MSSNNSSAAEKRESNARPDVAAIMADIRARVRADVESNRDKSPPVQRYVPGQQEAVHKAGELVHSEERHYLNTHCMSVYSPRLNLDAITSHRFGPIGKVIVKAKRWIAHIVWENIFKGLFAAQRDYQINLLRYLNHVSSYVDSRDSSNFWELIRKIDYDVTKTMERVERIADEQGAALRSLERRLFDGLDASVSDIVRQLGEINSELAKQSGSIEVLNGVTSGLESIAARMGKSEMPIASAEGRGPVPSEKLPDFSYLLLENRYRGSEQEIAKRLAIYPPYFAGSSLPVLEIGGGRGELQELFRASSIRSYNVDIDRAMVEAAAAKGLDARLGDGLSHLRSLDDGSLSGVIAVQVVEHLTRTQLEELFSLCKRKLSSGGKVIFETINPRSVLALSSNYFRDPTHVWPLHPDTLAYGLTLAGLRVVETRFLSPVPKEAMLQELELHEYMTPRWSKTIEALNSNIRRLNELLYGHQDYCIVAEA